MASSLKDVARLAEVSPITVSRVFSETHFVASETKERVLRAARELNYTPDLLAQSLVKKRSPTIGVLVPELANPFFIALVDAVQRSIDERGHFCVVAQSYRKRELEEQAVRRLLQLRVAGLLVVPLGEGLPLSKELRAATLPTVAMARRTRVGDFVTVDDEAGGALAASHLLELGHERLACVLLDELQNPALKDRLRGFTARATAGGVVLTQDAVIRTPSLALGAGRQAAARFLALRNRPSAVFVMADLLALGFIQGLLELGVRVPEDVSVIGYDDIPYAEVVAVPLTTIALPKQELGNAAAKALFDRMNAGSSKLEPTRIALQPTLLVRKSTAR
jgi:LacI family transcriptional regulator